MNRHLDIMVNGEVQGVFYRHSAKLKAADLGLSGFVRNEPDGCVSIEAEGPEEALEEFIGWCKQGSPLARVHDVEVVEGAWENYTGFEIA